MHHSNITSHICDLAKEFLEETPKEIVAEVTEPPTKKRKFNVYNLMDHILSTQTQMSGAASSNLSPDDIMREEMEAYELEKLIPHDDSPYRWWFLNEARFPNLARLAKKILSCPPSSVESERIFSIGSMIYSPKRNRISAISAERLMFINYNLRFFNMTYNYNYRLWNSSSLWMFCLYEYDILLLVCIIYCK